MDNKVSSQPLYLSEPLLERLISKAAEKGVSVDSYAEAILGAELLTFTEVTEPLRDAYHTEGYSSEQMEASLLESLRAVQKEKGEIED